MLPPKPNDRRQLFSEYAKAKDVHFMHAEGESAAIMFRLHMTRNLDTSKCKVTQLGKV